MATLYKSLIVLTLSLWITPVTMADLQQSLGELQDRAWQVRQAAATSLGESRTRDREAIAALTLALDDPDSRVRRSAADAIGMIGERANRSIPQLVAVFDDIDPNVVAAAAQATGQMGRRASRAVSDLMTLLVHDDARVREAASISLGNIGSRARNSAAGLDARLGDADPAVRAAAARSLGKLGSAPKATVSNLVRSLDDDDAMVRAAATDALAGIGRAAIPALVRALGNGDPVFLQAVVNTLGRIGPDAVTPLTDLLHDGSEPEIARGYAAMALARIAGRDGQVLPALIEALADENAGVRMSAAEALGYAGAEATAAVPDLIDVATSPREETLVREFAISALAKIGPDNAAVEDALVNAVSDGEPRIYQAAVEALLTVRAWRSGTPDVNTQVAQLIGELDGGSVAAAEALGLLGDKAEAAVPAVIRALEATDPELRDAALVALKRIGPQQQTVPALVQAMRAGDLASRGAAAARLQTFAKSRIEVWKPLLHQSEAPILRNWLARHEALYGFAPEEDLLERSTGEPRSASYFDIMGGRAAIRESIQLDLIGDPVAGAAGVRDIAIAALEPVRVDSHPFGKMLEGSNESIRRIALADYVPDDRFFAWFRNVDALTSVLDGGADQFMRFESSLAGASVRYELGTRYLRRFGVSAGVLERIVALRAIDELAIVAPDLFFIDGTDLTIVARLVSPSVTRSVLDLLGIDVPADGDVEMRETALGDSVYWSIRDDVLLFGTSEAEILRILALEPRRDRGSLGNSSEFLYMQQQLTIGENTEAYFYFSDPFIRHMVSPAVKIAQLRRMQARGEMEILVAGAMLYLLDGHRDVPGKQQLIDRGYAPGYLEDRDYTIGEDLIVNSGQYGTIASLKPVAADSVTRVSKREADAYRDFVDNYTRYWRQFFDPIAVRLDKAGASQFEIQSFILPLLDSDAYNSVKSALATAELGQALSIPVVTPVPSMMMSMNVNDDLRVGFSQNLADMLVEYTSVDPEIFDSIGSGVHLAVQDSTPIVALGAGDIWGAASAEMLNLEGFDSFLPFMASIVTRPSTILVELADPDKVHEFITEAVVKRAEIGGSGELHKVRDSEAWIYTLDFQDIVQIHLRLEIQNNYLLISNLPWTTAVSIGDAIPAELNGGQLTLDLTRMDRQLPALHTKVFTDYRAAAVDGMGYIYPLIEAGVADSVQQAIEMHLAMFGFEPVHPSSGQWLWRDSYLESTEFGTATQPVQPAFIEGDRSFGLFPDVDRIRVNMQLEDTGLRAVIAWSTTTMP